MPFLLMYIFFLLLFKCSVDAPLGDREGKGRMITWGPEKKSKAKLQKKRNEAGKDKLCVCVGSAA